MFKRNLICLTQLFNYSFLIIFYHVPPIYLKSESICVGAPTSLSTTFVDNWKYLLSNNLHAMVGIYKEWWLWYFLINFSFGWLQNLTSYTYGCILEHRSHFSFIIAYNREYHPKYVNFSCSHLSYQLFNIISWKFQQNN